MKKNSLLLFLLSLPLSMLASPSPATAEVRVARNALQVSEDVRRRYVATLEILRAGVTGYIRALTAWRMFWCDYGSQDEIEQIDVEVGQLAEICNSVQRTLDEVQKARE